MSDPVICLPASRDEVLAMSTKELLDASIVGLKRAKFAMDSAIMLKGMRELIPYAAEIEVFLGAMGVDAPQYLGREAQIKTGSATWSGAHTTATRDRMGGIAILHEDGTDNYVQPGDDAASLSDTLDACGDDLANIDALLCDYLEGLPA